MVEGAHPARLNPKTHSTDNTATLELLTPSDYRAESFPVNHCCLLMLIDRETMPQRFRSPHIVHSNWDCYLGPQIGGSHEAHFGFVLGNHGPSGRSRSGW